MNNKKKSNNSIQKEILSVLIILASVMAILVAAASIAVNISSENKRLDQNLQNVAQAVSRSQPVKEMLQSEDNIENTNNTEVYLDSLQSSLSNIDVISVVGADCVRRYHTNHSLIGTVYDGTLPDFTESSELYVTSDVGPSGQQRRAYAAIYDDNGECIGFVLAIILNKNISGIIRNTILIHVVCVAAVILLAVILSKELSRKIKRILHGYEPDTFSAMFSIRDNILESLEEGVIAVDTSERIIFINSAARKMLKLNENSNGDENISMSALSPKLSIQSVLKEGEKITGLSCSLLSENDVIIDEIPVYDQKNIAGALCILHDRTEYIKVMEELSGVKYMVESMRANNHDFINKLHVIMGYIQMGCTNEACDYIANITSIQQAVIGSIVKNIEDASVAALLIGKYTRTAELNIRFILKTGSKLSRNDICLASGDLVTIIGNLIENALDSMNEKAEMPKDLTIGIFTQPHAILISVDDTGIGMPDEICKKVFDNGYSTKGENRGTGLYIVNSLVNKYKGTISVESEPGSGTSFTVTLTDDGGR